MALLSFVLLAVHGSVNAQEPATQPATRAAPTSQERLGDLLALIEGQHAPEVRRTIARELLLQRWPETPPRIAALLSGSNTAAKVAVAGALQDLPEALDAAYVEPLLGMLSDPDAGVREAAGGVLASYPGGVVTPRLRQLVLDRQQPRTARLAGLNTLGLMTEREAVAVLVAALGDPDGGLVQAALGALGRATAMEFDDVATARTWWEDSTALSREDWQQLQIERLVRKDRETRRRLEATEARLARFMETSFVRASDGERVALLTTYLADSSSTVRFLGLRLAQLHLRDGKTLPPELQERIRELINSSETREQAAAVQTVASLRDPRDAERFAALLETARAREVQLALVNGLGYVGDGAVVPILLRALSDDDEQHVTEAVAALGRLAERGLLPEEARDDVARGLTDVFGRAHATQVAMRERVLWAMGNIVDTRFGPAFAAGLQRTEAVAVRLAAVRGLAALRDARWMDDLVLAVADPDVGVRKAAIETLVGFGARAGEKQLLALWERVESPQEADETVRQAAWHGLLEVLSGRSAEEVEQWLGRIPGRTPQDVRRAAELLERLVKIIQDTKPADGTQLGLTYRRLASQYVRLDQTPEAVAAYLEALRHLRAADAEAAGAVAEDLLRCALAGAQFDERVVAALNEGTGQTDGARLWEVAKSEIEVRLKPQSVEHALAIIAALTDRPLKLWPASAARELEALRTRAIGVQQATTSSAPAASTAPAPSAGRGGPLRR